MDTTEPFLEKPDREEHTRDRDDRIPDADLRPTPAPITTSIVPLSVKPTSLQQRMLALSGQNIDDFMKEMEEVHKKRELDRAADLSSRLSALERRREDTNGGNEDHPRDKDDRVAPPSMCPPGTNSSDAPAVMAPRPPPLMATLLRPPPLRPPGPPPPGLRMPSGMMPDRPAPPGPPPGLPPRLLRLPPGPPPGLPPRVLGMSRLSHPLGPHAVPLPLPVLSAAPQLINRKDGPQRGATIMAKPQIRNLSADVTRFVPSALRVKREDKKGKPGVRGPSIDIKKPADLPSKPPGAPTKDDAYMQFMREMQGLL